MGDIFPAWVVVPPHPAPGSMLGPRFLVPGHWLMEGLQSHSRRQASGEDRFRSLREGSGLGECLCHFGDLC